MSHLTKPDVLEVRTYLQLLLKERRLEEKSLESKPESQVNDRLLSFCRDEAVKIEQLIEKCNLELERLT